MANRFAHQLLAIRIVERSAFAVPSVEREAWARRVNRALDGAAPTFERNDVVTDGDTRSEYYGREFVVTAVNGDLLTMRDTAWGDVTISGAHRTFFESAGRRWTEKTCA